MLHDDLTLYTNKEYRSSHYLEKCWSLIEEKILFFIGFINKPMLSIKLESDCICLTIMNKEKIVYKEVITKNFSHSLNLCEDYSKNQVSLSQKSKNELLSLKIDFYI